MARARQRPGDERACRRQRVVRIGAAAAATLLLLTGCGSAGTGHRRELRAKPLPADYVPVGVGSGARYRPPPTTAAVRAGTPIDAATGGAGPRATCQRERGARVGAHLEIFVRNHVVAIPAGIGIAPPLRRDLAEGRIRRGRCYYPAITTDPTGLIELARDAPHTLGQFFAIWGQPLTARRLTDFAIPRHAHVTAYVGRQPAGVERWRGDPATIPLRRHTRVVLELFSDVPPHHSYAFPPGL